jgi:hypothetical protein
MPWLLSAATLALLSAAASASPQIAAPPPAPVCARIAKTLAAREEAPSSARARKVWIGWTVIDTPRDVAAAVTGKVVRVLGARAGQVLAITTAAQRARLPAGVQVIRDADEVDWVSCGSLGYQAALTGRVAPRLSLPSAWRDRDGARATYCMQLAVPPIDDAEHGALAAVLDLNDPAPMTCSDNPATCTLSLTAREATAVGRLRFVRGLIRREPAFKIGSSLACPGEGDLPVAPAELPAVLRAATARATERINATVILEGEPEEMAAVPAHLPAGARVVDGTGYLLTISLERRALPALAAMRTVWMISEQGPAPGID